MKQNKLIKCLALLAMMIGGASTAWGTVYTATTSTELMNYANGTSATLADGDIIELNYDGNGGGNKRFGLPTKKITIRAAAGKKPVMEGGYYNNSGSTANGSLTFEGIIIKPGTNFLSLVATEGSIETLTFRNCEITSGGSFTNSLITGGNASATINSIVLENCIIHDCGTGNSFIQPTHVVKSLTVKKCTMYKYGGQHFFSAVTAATTQAFTFVFNNNTVYQWADVSSARRAFAAVSKKYGTGSTYTFQDNIIVGYKDYEEGVSSLSNNWFVLADMKDDSNGTFTISNNILRGFKSLNEGDLVNKGSGTPTITITNAWGDNSTLNSTFGFETITSQFASTDASSEDFTLDMTTNSKLQSKATAADANHAGVLGDPRWAKFTLNESNNYTPVNLNGVKVALTRGITANKWSTIVLPFDIASGDIATVFGDGTSVAELSSGTENTLNFTTTLTGSKMKANQPYAIKVASNFSSKDINGVDIKVPASTPPTQSITNWNFVGTYSSTTVPEGSYYFKSNKLYQKGASGTTTMNAFRAYLTYTGGTSAPALNFIIDGETTGIAHINADGQMNLEEGAVYNLNGQRVANPTKGLYIVNGKKTIIK